MSASPVVSFGERGIGAMWNVNELLAFVDAQPADKRWFTGPRQRPFTARRVRSKLEVTIASGKVRNISSKSIATFLTAAASHGGHVRIGSITQNDSYLVVLAEALALAHRGDVMPPMAEEMPVGRSYREGAVKQVWVNAYERDGAAREACLAAHGKRCAVCRALLSETYGPIARNVVHVHHLRPLATHAGEEYELDPVRDLRPVCPNCHGVIHAAGGCLSIEEVQDLMAKASSS